MQTEVQPPDMASAIRAMGEVLERPGLPGGSRQLEVDSASAQPLGELVILLARLDFLLARSANELAKGNPWITSGSKPRVPYPSNAKVKFWIVESSVDSRGQLPEFADLSEVVRTKEPVALSAARSRFEAEFAKPLAALEEIRIFAINGVLPPKDDRSQVLENTKALLGALRISIEALPAAANDTSAKGTPDVLGTVHPDHSGPIGGDEQ